MEQKETGSPVKAASLIAAFENQFLAIQSTFHPPDLPAEVAGKGSNVAFAARIVFERHQMEHNKNDVIITVIDGIFCNANQSSLSRR